MQPIIEEKRKELEELCRRYHVKSLALFGSALRDDFDPERSDFDFAVEFDESMVGQRFRIGFELSEALEQLFHRRVDVVQVKNVRNPYVRRAIERELELLYAA
jgi:uncharacterized protein